MKKRWLFILLVLMLLLGGCAKEQKKTAATPSPLPQTVEAPEIEAEGALAEAARKRMDIYERQLNRIALQYPQNFSYTIPGDLMAQMARDAEEMGVAPVNGRYQFTWQQSSRHTYQISALEITEKLLESVQPDPSLETDETVPDGQKMGDFIAAGGGNYDRTHVYDVAQDLSSGTMEMTDLLNGEVTGHEVFSFRVERDVLYFVDAALELKADLDLLVSDGSYLVAIGKMEKDRVEILEYKVADEQDIPSAFTMDWEQLAGSVNPTAHLTARGDQLEEE